jgi:hypothetical protein
MQSVQNRVSCRSEWCKWEYQSFLAAHGEPIGRKIVVVELEQTDSSELSELPKVYMTPAL